MYRESKVTGRKPGLKSTVWSRRKKQEFQKLRRGSGNSGTTKCSNIRIIGAPEGEEEKQEIENLFENTVEKYFPNLVKGIDIQVQEAQRVQKKLDPKRTTPRYIIIKMPKVKNKERILKVTREKQKITYKGIPIKL